MNITIFFWIHIYIKTTIFDQFDFNGNTFVFYNFFMTIFTIVSLIFQLRAFILKDLSAKGNGNNSNIKKLIGMSKYKSINPYWVYTYYFICIYVISSDMHLKYHRPLIRLTYSVISANSPLNKMVI